MADVPYRLVYVEWEDSFGVGGRWAPLDDSEVIEPFVCVSVGWVTAENRDRIQVTPHLGLKNDVHDTTDGCGEMVIPRSAIRRLIVIPSTITRKRKRRTRCISSSARRTQKST